MGEVPENQPEEAKRRDWSRVEVGGLDIDAIEMDHLATLLVSDAIAGHGKWVVTANLDHLRRCRDGSGYSTLMSAADLIVADGRPLLWAASLAGTHLPGLVAGSDLTPVLAREAAEQSARVLLVGGAPGAAEGAREALLQLAPSLDIAGIHIPPMGFEDDPLELAALERAVSSSSADLVLVALGSPLQERCIERLREHLPGASWVGVGITLSYLSGDVSRAPKWMRRAGLEWSYRLACEPRRLFRRYVLQCLPFGLKLMMESLTQRWTQRQAGGAVS
jgi:N-acetylglucosaminyldiphosphoundecaprenol N-acetyl-beta-D-mannosaminyltransferase